MKTFDKGFNPFGNVIHLPGKMFTYEDNIDYDTYYEQRKEFYIEHNNWDRTFEDQVKQIQEKKKLDRLIVSINKDRDGFEIVIPHTYTGTIKESFEYTLPIMFEGKKGFVSNRLTGKYVEEIKLKKFVKN